MNDETTRIPAPTPTETVRALYEAFGIRDEAALRAVLAPDVIWNQCAGMPGGARRRGADDVVAGIFHGLSSTWEGFGAPVEELLADGHRVVALGHYAGVHAVTKRAMRSAFAHVYEVEDGRVVRFDQIADTWPMVAAMRDEAV
ncbi:nuclear transport factor 2 family protein [Engelhardtia mirabilis]|uniref:SnoaL-like domain protein n=1 Tax=Engelhardtia mirabilis TaxID=2528011 RepID=A0A518BR44_9BACT|nr:SnoaL-like domain protein [Planctomycetes bacterium Pla133]QDV03762.1 SnoaL-like domain protein [Planctomycetes bacterium Pla86]